MTEQQPDNFSSIFPPRITEFLGRPDFFRGIQEVKPLDLTPQQREELFGKKGYEARWAERLGAILEKKVPFHTLFAGWLATDEGWERAKELYGRANPELKEMTKPESAEGAAEIFWGLKNLAGVEEEARKEAYGLSLRWARDRFLEQFFQSRGNLEKVEEPLRVARVLDIQALKEKVEALRQFKRDIKKEEERIKEEKGDFAEAERIILSLYRRRVNMELAGIYSLGVLVVRQPNISPEEKEKVLCLIRGCLPGVAFRTLERMDHFLRGVGPELGEDKLWETIPEAFAQYIEEKAKQPMPEESNDYKKYQEYEVGAEQAERLCQVVLRLCGFENWGTKIKINITGFAVSYSDGVVEVGIPQGLKMGLSRLMAILAHEIEGHAWRLRNRRKVPLRLVREFGSPRGESLSEAAGVWTEKETLKKAFEMEEVFEKRAYYWILREKERGGSFKDCFRAALLAKLGGEENLEELLGDGKRFFKEGRAAFRETLRLFDAGKIPLDDKNGFLGDSAELSYLEQEVVTRQLGRLESELISALKERKDAGKTIRPEEEARSRLTRLIFVGGIDIYSVVDLLKLGVLKIEDIEEPPFVVADQIWPRIKEVLDRGGSLEEAIETAEKLVKTS